MTVSEVLTRRSISGVTLAAGEEGKLRVSPPGVLPAELREPLQAHKRALRRLLTAPPADFPSDEPCDACGSRERWLRLDGRELCSVCLVLDLAPMTLGPGGWDRPPLRQEEVA